MCNYKVSVIIPIYNVEQYLKDCIESVISQMNDSIQIVLVNDGSTDNSIKIAEYYANDTNVILINQKNKGLGAARNTGLEHASGEYILFLDSDDMIKENSIFEMYNICKENSLDMLLFSSSVFSDSSDMDFPLNMFNYERDSFVNEIMTGQELFEKTYAINEYRVSVCMRMFKCDYIKQKKLKFREGVIHEDEDYALLSLLLANRVMAINTKYYQRRVRANSIMTASSLEKHIIAYMDVYDALSEKFSMYDTYFFDSSQVKIFLVNLLYMCFLYCVSMKKANLKSKTYEHEINKRAKNIHVRSLGTSYKHILKLLILKYIIGLFSWVLSQNNKD